jgi:hypothetical protein
MGKSHTEELLHATYSQYRVGAIKLMRMRWVEQLVLMGEMRNAYFFKRRPQIKGSLGEYGHRLEDNIKMNPKIENIM